MAELNDAGNGNIGHKPTSTENPLEWGRVVEEREKQLKLLQTELATEWNGFDFRCRKGIEDVTLVYCSTSLGLFLLVVAVDDDLGRRAISDPESLSGPQKQAMKLSAEQKQLDPQMRDWLDKLKQEVMPYNQKVYQTFVKKRNEGLEQPDPKEVERLTLRKIRATERTLAREYPEVANNIRKVEALQAKKDSLKHNISKMEVGVIEAKIEQERVAWYTQFGDKPYPLDGLLQLLEELDNKFKPWAVPERREFIWNIIKNWFNIGPRACVDHLAQSAFGDARDNLFPHSWRGD